MAYRFLDPRPFMPPHAQRIMVPGRSVATRVVVGRVQEHTNDMAIAILHPLPAEQLNFENIRNALIDFLNVHLGFPTLTIQPCPHD